MQKAMVLMLAMAAVMMFSGCAAVGKYSSPVEGGKKTTVGLISIESIGDGYPMIPVYSSFEQGK